ncbi:hypothetical protein [Caulobacter sp. DWP3-1-3b2]|uniref:hypothetical protein n=1 Tax=Caulobacter sp. DWP3-1-3b2 TaxID=2804643 RepID=UPI003CEDB0B6
MNLVEIARRIGIALTVSWTLVGCDAANNPAVPSSTPVPPAKAEHEAETVRQALNVSRATVAAFAEARHQTVQFEDVTGHDIKWLTDELTATRIREAMMRADAARRESRHGLCDQDANPARCIADVEKQDAANAEAEIIEAKAAGRCILTKNPRECEETAVRNAQVGS